MNQSKYTLSLKEIDDLLSAAGAAPSGGNVQPWKVKVIQKNKIEISLDKKRSESFLDVKKLASYLALGAFLENLTTMADSLGLTHDIKILQENKFSLNVQINFFKKTRDKQKIPLSSVIFKRCTNRKLYDGKIIVEEKITKLQTSIKNLIPQFQLHLVQKESQKKALVDILGAADGIRTQHDELFTQMMDELRWQPKEVTFSKDGIDIATLEMPQLMVKMLFLLQKHPLIRKTIPPKVFEDQAKPLLLSSSHLGCLTTTLPLSAYTLLDAGRVMERLWLTATKEDIWLHPWTILPFLIFRVQLLKGKGFTSNHISDLLKLNEQLKKSMQLSSNETPFFIFRLFTGKPPTARSLRLNWRAYTTLVD